MGSVTTHTSVAGNSEYTYGRSVIAMGNAGSSDTNRTNVAYSSMSVAAEGGGSTVISGTDVSHGLSSTGTVAYNNSRGVLMTVASTINGSSNTSLYFGSRDVEARSIAYITGVYLRNVNGWSYESGIPISSSASNYSFGNDDAATPTRAVPGELIYGETGDVPTSGEYPARTT